MGQRKDWLRRWYQRAQFDFEGISGWLAIACNPFYFNRRGLFHAFRALAPHMTGRVLDFGCGSKPYERLFTACSEYIGCDVEVSGHDHANEQIDVYYDGHHIPFEDGSVDSIFAAQSFEHIPNLNEVLVELHRILKIGGEMVISVPFVWNEHEVPYDFRRFTSYGVRRLLERAGFEIIELHKSNLYVGTLVQMAMEYVRKQMAERISGKLSILLQCCFLAPMTLAGLVLERVLPEDDSFYSDNIFLCRKTK